VSPPLGPTSPLFDEYRSALREAARLGPVADLACGRGRHALAAAGLGLVTLALDRSESFLRELAGRAARASLPVRPLRCDLERGDAIPLRPGACGAVLVFRYLHRPLAPAIADCLAPGGLLLYETFTTAQRELGAGPTNPAFLLEPGELPRLFPGLERLSFDEALRDGEATARLAARRPR
jgi:SAM-dependent methyltransferase